MSVVEKIARRRTVDPGPERAVRPLPEAPIAPPKPAAPAAPLPPDAPRVVRMLRTISTPLGAVRKGLQYDVVAVDEFDGVTLAVGEHRVTVEAGDYEPVDVERYAKAEALRDEAIRADAKAIAKRLTGGKSKRIDPPHPATRVDPAAAVAELPTEQLPLGRLDRHPENRRPAEADVAERAESLRSRGQLEAILVRRGPGGRRYQILSGETRYLAAAKLGWPTIAAKVLDPCDDAQALELLAVANASRKDLDAIQKARLIERLCTPREAGGAGLTREQAAKIYGLESGAGASNLVRLLELPSVWQQRVASGELPQTFARELLPLAHAPRLLEHVEKDWQAAHHKLANAWDRESWLDRDGVATLVENVIDRHTRTIDPKVKQLYVGGEVSKGTYFRGEFGRLFELSDMVRHQLDVVTVKIDGKEMEVATNVKRWDELQLPLVQAACAKKRKGKAAAACDDDERKAKKLTPAEAKAAAKLKADQLDHRIRGWRHEWLRELIAADLLKTEAGNAIARKFFLSFCMSYAGYPNLDRHVREALNGELPSGFGDADTLSEAYAATTTIAARDRNGLDDLGCKALLTLLALEDRDAKTPWIPHAVVDGMAAELGIDLARAWKALQAPGVDGSRLESFLLLHSAEQLAALNAAEKWGLYLDGKGKAQMVRSVVATARTLPLPKSIPPVEAPTANAGKRKRGR